MRSRVETGSRTCYRCIPLGLPASRFLFSISFHVVSSRFWNNHAEEKIETLCLLLTRKNTHLFLYIIYFVFNLKCILCITKTNYIDQIVQYGYLKYLFIYLFSLYNKIRIVSRCIKFLQRFKFRLTSFLLMFVLSSKCPVTWIEETNRLRITL